MRANEPGWVRIGRYCGARRRALWFRVPDGHGVIDEFELCAGREGDDDYVKVDRSNPQFGALLDVLSTAAFAVAPESLPEGDPNE